MIPAGITSTGVCPSDTDTKIVRCIARRMRSTKAVVPTLLSAVLSIRNPRWIKTMGSKKAPFLEPTACLHPL